MMKPLSYKKRFLYFISLVVVFIVAIPIIILYAGGYRLGSGFSVVKTGGILIHSDFSSTDILLSGVSVNRTSLFQKDIFLDDLKPDVYAVEARKEGYQTWSQKLSVFPEQVTWASAFMLPVVPEFMEIPQYVNQGTTTQAFSVKKTDIVSPDEHYVSILKIFLPQKSVTLSTTATSTKIYRRVRLEEGNGAINVSWGGAISAAPYYLCTPEKCVDRTRVYQGSFRHFDFYPGRNDVVLISHGIGVYAHQIDSRGVLSPQILFEGKSPDFRIVDGIIYIKDGTLLFSLEP